MQPFPHLDKRLRVAVIGLGSMGSGMQDSSLH